VADAGEARSFSRGFPEHPVRFRDECKDFLRFIRNPSLAPRLPGGRSGSGTRADWFAGLSLPRLLQWALLLWAWNLFLLGPLAVVVAYLGGAQHRLLGMNTLPWLQALLLAPLVEELLFRHGLRRPAQALWVIPAAAVVLAYGMRWSTGLLLAVVLLCIVLQTRRGGKAMPWSWRRAYRRSFVWVFYGATTCFALLHLLNFNLHQTPWWLLPLLVLPQWCTGLVLGWLRVRRGIGAAMLLHALFNGGPLLLVWLLLGAMRGA